MGEKLARKILAIAPALDIDIVIPIPETSRTAALTCAQVLQKPYREGFIKNRYIARTFLMPVRAHFYTCFFVITNKENKIILSLF